MAPDVPDPRVNLITTHKEPGIPEGQFLAVTIMHDSGFFDRFCEHFPEGSRTRKDMEINPRGPGHAAIPATQFIVEINPDNVAKLLDLRFDWTKAAKESALVRLSKGGFPDTVTGHPFHVVLRHAQAIQDTLRRIGLRCGNPHCPHTHLTLRAADLDLGWIEFICLSCGQVQRLQKRGDDLDFAEIPNVVNSTPPETGKYATMQLAEGEREPLPPNLSWDRVASALHCAVNVAITEMKREGVSIPESFELHTDACLSILEKRGSVGVYYQERAEPETTVAHIPMGVEDLLSAFGIDAGATEKPEKSTLDLEVPNWLTHSDVPPPKESLWEHLRTKHFDARFDGLTEGPLCPTCLRYHPAYSNKADEPDICLIAIQGEMRDNLNALLQNDLRCAEEIVAANAKALGKLDKRFSDLEKSARKEEQRFQRKIAELVDYTSDQRKDLNERMDKLTERLARVESQSADFVPPQVKVEKSGNRWRVFRLGPDSRIREYLTWIMDSQKGEARFDWRLDEGGSANFFTEEDAMNAVLLLMRRNPWVKSGGERHASRD